jgi:hypothetical protein
MGVCQGCMETLIGNTTQFFFDARNGLIRQAQLRNLVERLAPLPTVESEIDHTTSQAWPSVPLGAVIWTLCSSRYLAPFVKAWVTGTIDITVRLGLRLGLPGRTFCPNHPDLSYPVPAALTELRCPHCHLMFCKSCRLWHENTRNCEAPPVGTMHCPYCHMPVSKNGGCNHIACRCGKHWCYICGQGCLTEADVHEHLYQSHRG